MNIKNVILAYYILCLIATATMLCFGCWRYLQNESTSLVEFQTYHTTERDIYPSISLCFWGEGIYKDKNLTQSYELENVSRYMNFLQGNIWDNRMLKIDYDSVTLDLKDHVYSVGALNRKWEPLYFWTMMNANKQGPESAPTEFFPFHTSHRHSAVKCFSLDLDANVMPGIAGNVITVVEIQFSDIIIPNVQMSYSLHYPGQFLRGLILDVEDSWNIRITSGNVKSKTIVIDMVDVIRRRNTHRTPCGGNSVRDDDSILTSIVETADCKPPHWKNIDGYPICNDTRKMREVYVDSNFPTQSTATFLQRFVKPCNQVKTVTSAIREGTRGPFSHLLKDTRDKSVKLSIVFRNQDYKEIRHQRDFDFESLVGNIGGYVGLLLGFALWQIPDAIKLIVDIIVNVANKGKRVNNS